MKQPKLPGGKFVLTDGQLSLLDTCLSIAVAKFRENMATLSTIEGVHQRLVLQFEHQAEETELLRLRIALAESIEIGGECE